MRGLPPRPGAGALRVATLNLASGRRADGAPASREELAAALAPLEDLGVHLVALQEVDVAQPRSRGGDQAALAAAAVGARDWRMAATLAGTPGLARSWTPLPAVLRGPGEGPAGPLYGTALLARVPVHRWHALDLGSGRGRLPLRVTHPQTGRATWLAFPDEPRAAVAAELESGAVVAATHLSFAPPTAVRQLRALRRWLQGLGAPGALRLVAGDLNLPGAVVRLAAGGPPLVRGATYPGPAPRLQLDHVVSVGGPASGRGGPLDLAVGDHRALVVDVTPDGR